MGNNKKKPTRRWIIVLALAIALGLPLLGGLIIVGYFIWEYYHPQ